MAVDFLPLCDLLFNFISVTTYFCNIAFDVIVTYTLYNEGRVNWFCVLFFAIVISILLCQVFSLKWFVEEDNGENSKANWTLTVAIHVALSGVLWRYARLLFVPIDISLVKREMRNLSILRMIHAFVQCLISLILQGYLLTRSGEDRVSDENRSILVTACSLCLVNICWAIASFNKNIHAKNIHKLILTWIGVIFQFMWRIGTVGSRCLALVLYASVHHGWLFLFGLLHFLCMVAFTIFQKKEENLKKKLLSLSFIIEAVLISYIYMVDFINFEEGSTKYRIVLYYAIVFTENMLLVTLWSINIGTTLLFTYEERITAFLLVSAPFAIGMLFMLMYYKVFHVTKTSAALGLSSSPEFGSSNVKRDFTLNSSANKTVFNCALNPAMKKRKKIPRVIPPPPSNEMSKQPFWKEPLPQIPGDPNSSPDQLKAANGFPNGQIDTEMIRRKLEDKRRKQQEQLRSLQNQHPYSRLEYQNRLSGHFRQTSLSHDSSGDQGDIDSTEENIDYTLPHENGFHVSNLPELITSSTPGYRSYSLHGQNGYKAETRL